VRRPKPAKPAEMVRYSLIWRLPHVPCPGDPVLISVDVERGVKCPPEVLALWVPGGGYAVTWQLLNPAPPRRWSIEAKGRVRELNLKRRLEKKLPLFANIFAEQELARRPDYFAGKDTATSAEKANRS